MGRWGEWYQNKHQKYAITSSTYFIATDARQIQVENNCSGIL